MEVKELSFRKGRIPNSRYRSYYHMACLSIPLVKRSMGYLSECDHSLFSNFWYIQITQFDHAWLCQEQVSAFDISMANFEVMKCFEPSNSLDKVMPDLFFSILAFAFLMFLNCLEEITVVTNLHDNAQVAWLILEEGLFVSDNIWVVDWGQYSNFV